MLQWSFEAVSPTNWFPLGVKTMYRPFSSDRVIVFEFKNKDECLSPVGMATGMEPITLYNTWRPSATDDSSRPGIEGFFLLRNMPHWDGNLLPVPFPDDCTPKMQSTMVEISKTYEASNHRMVREQWNKWQEKFFPRDPDSSVYIQQLRQQGIEYKIPLKQILLNKTVIIVEPQWLDRPPLEETPSVGCIFDWPEVLAAAMHSVCTDMNRNPQPVRVYAASDAELIIDRNHFSENVSAYYDSILRLTVARIRKIANRKVGYNGKLIASGEGGIYLFRFHSNYIMF